MRVVLDSNVWLDWLVFDDPRVAQLKQAKRDGVFHIVIDQPCRDELRRVLAYEQFGLDETRQKTLLAEADRLSTLLDNLRYLPAEELPWCSDPDDVKFLALSAVSEADWLITKDKALLSKRRRKNMLPVCFRIGTPEQWAASVSQNAVSSV